MGEELHYGIQQWKTKVGVNESNANNINSYKIIQERIVSEYQGSLQKNITIFGWGSFLKLQYKHVK